MDATIISARCRDPGRGACPGARVITGELQTGIITCGPGWDNYDPRSNRDLGDLWKQIALQIISMRPAISNGLFIALHSF